MHANSQSRSQNQSAFGPVFGIGTHSKPGIRSPSAPSTQDQRQTNEEGVDSLIRDKERNLIRELSTVSLDMTQVGRSIVDQPEKLVISITAALDRGGSGVWRKWTT